MTGPSICIDMLWPEMEAHDKLTLVRECGISHVEFWGWREKDISSLRDVARELGVTVTNFSAHRCGSPVNRAEHERVLSEMVDAAVVAETLGCDRLMVLSNELGEGGKVVNSFPEIAEPEKHDAFCELLLQALRVIPERISLVIEPLNTTLDHGGNYLRSMRQAAEIVDAVDDSRISVLADLYHLGMMGEMLSQTIERYSNYIGYVHVADIPGRGEPGTGEIDWASILARLSERGYEGVVGFEYNPVAEPGDSLDAVTRLWDALQLRAKERRTYP